jgi:hypothetical protein
MISGVFLYEPNARFPPRLYIAALSVSDRHTHPESVENTEGQHSALTFAFANAKSCVSSATSYCFCDTGFASDPKIGEVPSIG